MGNGCCSEDTSSYTTSTSSASHNQPDNHQAKKQKENNNKDPTAPFPRSVKPEVKDMKIDDNITIVRYHFEGHGHEFRVRTTKNCPPTLLGVECSNTDNLTVTPLPPCFADGYGKVKMVVPIAGAAAGEETTVCRLHKNHKGAYDLGKFKVSIVEPEVQEMHPADNITLTRYHFPGCGHEFRVRTTAACPPTTMGINCPKAENLTMVPLTPSTADGPGRMKVDLPIGTGKEEDHIVCRLNPTNKSNEYEIGSFKVSITKKKASPFEDCDEEPDVVPMHIDDHITLTRYHYSGLGHEFRIRTSKGCAPTMLGVECGHTENLSFTVLPPATVVDGDHNKLQVRLPLDGDEQVTLCRLTADGEAGTAYALGKFSVTTSKIKDDDEKEASKRNKSSDDDTTDLSDNDDAADAFVARKQAELAAKKKAEEEEEAAAKKKKAEQEAAAAAKKKAEEANAATAAVAAAAAKSKAAQASSSSTAKNQNHQQPHHDSTAAVSVTAPPPSRCFKRGVVDKPLKPATRALLGIREAPPNRPDLQNWIPDKDDGDDLLHYLETALPDLKTRPAVKKLISECDLTDDEIMVLHSYKIQDPYPVYLWLNGWLGSSRRDQFVKDNVAPFFKLLYRAMEKLPRVKTQANRAIKVNGIPALKNTFDNHTAVCARGQILSFWGFSSFSTEDDVVNREEFVGKPHEQAIIYSCGELEGVDMEPFAPQGLKSESEILPLCPCVLETTSSVMVGEKLVISVTQKNHADFAYVAPNSTTNDHHEEVKNDSAGQSSLTKHHESKQHVDDGHADNKSDHHAKKDDAAAAGAALGAALAKDALLSFF